jgi:hypothetical protein
VEAVSGEIHVRSAAGAGGRAMTATERVVKLSDM